MAVIPRIVKPTTSKGKRALVEREPQTIEAPKQTLFLKGRKSSEGINEVLHELFSLKKPDAHMLSRRNDVTIFENPTPVEVLCKRHNCALFVLGSCSKKRPDNLVLGRLYDGALLDMVELGINSYSIMKEFPGPKIPLGTKPCIVFAGPAWEQTDEMRTLQSLFVDLFHREHANAVRLQGLEHIISICAGADGRLLLRSYHTLLKKSGTHTPRVELEEMGPRLDLSIRRSRLASDDLMKRACRRPAVLRVRAKKNVSRDALGTTRARIHVGTQKISSLQTRRMKGLRDTPAERRERKRLAAGTPPGHELPSTKSVQLASEAPAAVEQ